jgi:hypothetical protein
MAGALLASIALAFSFCTSAGAVLPQHGATASKGAAPSGNVTLTNLTKSGHTVAAGNAACPNQSYYLYSGGKSDAFTSPTDPAYLSPNLSGYLSGAGSVQGIVPYDEPMDNGVWGDSFNLQNTRGVCYAIIKFRTEATGDIVDNDAFLVGHLESGSGPFDLVARIDNPDAKTGVQAYALDATGLSLLSQQTGYNLDKTLDQSILDTYLEDDSSVDFFQIYIWYGPNCSEAGTC